MGGPYIRLPSSDEASPATSAVRIQDIAIVKWPVARGGKPEPLPAVHRHAPQKVATHGHCTNNYAIALMQPKKHQNP